MPGDDAGVLSVVFWAVVTAIVTWQAVKAYDFFIGHKKRD